MATLSIRLTSELEEKLDQEARRSETNRSEVAREALVDFLRRRERERFMAELLEEARQLKGDPETQRLVEEWVPVDNEARKIAEGPAAEGGDEEEPWWE
jgi:predicted transcriptional regulator